MTAPLACYGSDTYINYEIGLLSLYLTFHKDTLSQSQVSQKIELAKDGLLLGLEDSFTEKFSRFLRRDTLTLSQVFLAKEKKKQEEIAL